MLPRLLVASALSLLALAAGPPRALAQAAAAPAEASFLIVNPGGRGNQSKAQGFLHDLAAALSSAWPPDAGPAPAWSGNYHVTEADALASIRGRRPAFALVSPGFLEAHREDLGLEPVAVPVRVGETPRRLRLVLRAGDAATAGKLDARRLAGLRFGGQVAAEPDWTRRHVLAPFGDPGDASLVSMERSLEAVRALQGNQIDVALLEDEDWARLVETGRADGLAAERVTDVLPEGPAVALVDPGAAPDVQDAQRALGRAAGLALTRLADRPDGKAVLERMTLRRFDLPPAPQ